MGGLVLPLGERSTVEFSGAEDMALFRECFEAATAEDFEASIQAAVRGIDEVRSQQAGLMQELAGFNMDLLGAGEAGPGECESGPLQVVNPAGQIRNRAHGYKRRANELVDLIKERKEFLDAKLGQKMALAMAALGDMQKVVKQLEYVVHTVQLYLGREEEVVCLTEGEPAKAETPICIRQNVLYMDEECALVEDHGIDFSEIEKFDQWLLSKPEHLAQVLPEPKGVVVLQVRRRRKDYAVESFGDILENAAKNRENAKSYWLIRNGGRLHRIHAEIRVGERLVPREDELDHFFFHRVHGTQEVEAYRPGSREYMIAMESAGNVRRHYMQLAMVLQGLIDRTLLFAPYKDGARPNLLDVDNTAGVVHFLRDVEKTLTDGRPSFQDWLARVNSGLQHGSRIVGYLPTVFNSGDESRITPKHASGVNDELVHTVLEGDHGLYFRFKRSDTIYGRYGCQEAKRAGTYSIRSSDGNFLCIDAGVTNEEIQYYLTDRRHRSEYESMVPCLKAALKVRHEEAAAEEPFRGLLLRKLEEAVPHNPCSPEILERLILWWKTKTKEHRALMAADSKAFRMIMARYKAQADEPMVEADKAAMVALIGRVPDAIFAFHLTGHDFGILRTLDNSTFFLREETYRVSEGTPHVVSSSISLPQKAEYEAYLPIFSTEAWSKRLSYYSPKDVLSPEMYPALADFVRGNPWFSDDEEAKEDNTKLVAIYALAGANHLEVRAAVVALDPYEHPYWSSAWSSDRKREPYQPLERIPFPSFTERLVTWKAAGCETKFVYRRAFGSRTWVDGEGTLNIGWEKDSPEAFIIYFNPDALDEAKRRIAERIERNEQISQLWDWIRQAENTAEQFLIANWKQGHLAKYLAQGGEISFFEDHLKTVPKYEPKADFVSGFIERAINAGSSPEELSKTPIGEIVQALPATKPNHERFPSRQSRRAAEIPEAEHRILVDSLWTPPPFLPEATG